MLRKVQHGHTKIGNAIPAPVQMLTSENRKNFATTPGAEPTSAHDASAVLQTLCGVAREAENAQLVHG